MIGYGNSMFLATHGILARSASGGGIDPDAQAFITAAAITDPTQQSAINTLVTDLKGYSIWTKFKAIYPIVGGTSSAHAVNLKTPGTHNLSFASGWTHSSTGMTPLNTYADTNLLPSSILTLNSSHLSYYSRTTSNGTEIEIGSRTSVGSDNGSLIEIRTSGTTYFRVNSASTYISASDSDSKGLYIANRTSSTIVNGWKNSTKIATGAVSSSSLSGVNIYIGAWNSGGATFFTTKQCAFASIGDGLDDTEAAQFATTVEKYQTTLGRSMNPWYDNGTLLLDTYQNSSAAYSLRKLRNFYIGAAIRVRRSSDNTEQDIYFNSTGNLDTTSLLSFVGAGNGFITTWYDQSGNANNATMSTAINQPQIVQAGSVLTVNSKPSISLDGGLQYLNLSSSITAGASSFNTFVGKRDASGRRLFGLAGGNAQQYLWGLWTDNKYYLQAITNTFQSSTATDTSTSQLLLTGQNAAGSMSIFKNNSTITSTQGTFSFSPVIGAIGFYLNSTNLAHCNLQEIVFYNSNQATNRTGIETNINTFYSIY